MPLLAALLIALLPVGALAQSTTTPVDQSGNPPSTYGGGSAYGGGSSGYDGGGIGSVTSVEPKSKTRGQPPNMGGDYGYGDKSKPAQPR